MARAPAGPSELADAMRQTDRVRAAQAVMAGDQPPIAILLCTGKNQELVEFALADMTNNLFVSKYQVQLPDKAQITAFLQQAMRELAP